MRIAEREGAEHPEGDVSWRARQLRRAKVLFCVGLVLHSPLALLI